ncbi:DNA recombination-mediator protein A [Palleronia pelagia]|uniref:DNA recombination-mediator protein A n=1 Tax=Palleronia pelagia TaxID=387096 RepID=A0A1H8JES0_9RHOB|nr:DNA-processing protein DprA [Palleronia pelagia]SEN79343.1 DNA recombination-mediator protein A [Palleronia pelagia]
MDLFPSITPLTPPHSEEEWLDWLRLLRSRRVGVSTFFRLMTEHGSAAAALDALPAIATAAGVSDYAPVGRDSAADELRRGRLAGARLIAWGSDAYPPALADIPDPPPLLWALGRPAMMAQATVAMVGARNASSLGLRMARSMADGLGREGIVTVSGLARGIDTEVHKATLATGTIAVMAGGVDVVYPPENAVLAREIEEHGLILSEQPIGLKPQARHFPRRNRLIAGLSRGVLVVEAAAKSGSLITARDALDQGREVWAVPGHPFDARAAGCNMLIRDGATLVRGPRDIAEALAALPAQSVAAAVPADEDARRTTDPVVAGATAVDRNARAQTEQSNTEEAPRSASNGSGADERATADPDRSEQAISPAATGKATSEDTAPRPDASLGAQQADRKAKHARTAAEIPQNRPAPRSLSETAALHQQILDRLGPSPTSEDQLIRDLGQSTSRVTAEIVTLELDGRILRQPGGLLSRV